MLVVSQSTEPFSGEKRKIMSNSIVAIKKGEDGRMLTYEALREIEADKILSGSKRVLIKPNITADMPASTGVTTHPSMVEGTLQFMKDIGVMNDVIVGEGGYCDITKASDKFGFFDIAKRYGARLVDFNRDEEIFLPVPNPLAIERFGIAKTVTECDCIIDLPCLKVHTSEISVTMSMKNMMGCIVQNRQAMHRDFDKKIIDLLKVVRPTLNIIDGIVGREGGEIEGDPVGTKVIIASKDFVAADAVGAAVMGFKQDEVEYIRLAQTYGFGNAELENIEIKGASIESVRRPFKRAPRNMPAHWYDPQS